MDPLVGGLALLAAYFGGDVEPMLRFKHWFDVVVFICCIEQHGRGVLNMFLYIFEG